MAFLCILRVSSQDGRKIAGRGRRGTGKSTCRAVEIRFYLRDGVCLSITEDWREVGSRKMFSSSRP